MASCPRRLTAHWAKAASGMGKRSFSSVWHLWDHILIAMSRVQSPGLPSAGESWTYHSVQQRPTTWSAYSVWTRGRWGCSVWRRKGYWCLLQPLPWLKRRNSQSLLRLKRQQTIDNIYVKKKKKHHPVTVHTLVQEPRDVLESNSLEMFRTQMDMVLSSFISWIQLQSWLYFVQGVGLDDLQMYIWLQLTQFHGKVWTCKHPKKCERLWVNTHLMLEIPQRKVYECPSHRKVFQWNS